MLTTIGVAGAIPAAYPKAIGPTTFNSFGPPDGGTRRSYNGSTDQFIDSPGWTWASGGPLAALVSGGYTLTVQVQASQLESNAGTSHTYRMKVAAANTGPAAVNSNAAGQPTQSGYVALSPTNASGTITFGDYCSASQTAHQGIITVSYQYTRP